jgi:DNA-directed RNA polymerase specialized sigma24 family protein
MPALSAQLCISTIVGFIELREAFCAAEDAVQDAAFENLASYCGEPTLATWLSRIT